MKSPLGETIDRSKLRAAIRHLRHAEIYLMLDEAIDALSDRKLLKLARRYLDPKALLTTGSQSQHLLADVQAFEKASIEGEYYQSFMVNSKNCTEKSNGTIAWIAECNRLFDQCVTQSKTLPASEIVRAIDIIVELLRRIDQDPDTILFFADEAGAWQVGVDWDKVFPVWFKCLSAVSRPEVYAKRVLETIDEFCRYNRAKHLATSRRCASPEQRQALDLAVAGRTLKS